jgi:hypothetical protein
LSLTASAISEHPVTLIRYLDVVLLVVAAPILLLIGAPAVGYAVGAGAWIALRVVGEGVERYANATTNRAAELTVRTAYPVCRVFLLSLTVILVRQGEGRADGVAALVVIVLAFTIHLVLSFVNRPRTR